jgi:predicted RNase H-like HicB family nuclease
MTRYFALVESEEGVFGVTFPDLAGCTAMGATAEEALDNAAEALRDWVEVAEARRQSVPPPRGAAALLIEPEVKTALDQGAFLAWAPLVREIGRPVKANLSINSGILAAIDAAAELRGVTRSALVEMLAKRALPELT